MDHSLLHPRSYLGCKRLLVHGRTLRSSSVYLEKRWPSSPERPAAFYRCCSQRLSPGKMLESGGKKIPRSFSNCRSQSRFLLLHLFSSTPPFPLAPLSLPSPLYRNMENRRKCLQTQSRTRRKSGTGSRFTPGQVSPPPSLSSGKARLKKKKANVRPQITGVCECMSLFTRTRRVTEVGPGAAQVLI